MLRGFWGFDHEAVAQQVIDTNPGATGFFTFHALTPYSEGQAVCFSNFGLFLRLEYDQQGKWIVGYHMYPGVPTGQKYLVRLWDGATEQLRLEYNTSGRLEVCLGSGAILATSAQQYWDPLYYHIEFRATIHHTAGAYAVRVNNRLIPELCATGVDTQVSANASANAVQVGTGNSMLFDNLYVCDGSGASFNDFLGERRVIACRPNAAGTYTQWTPKAGANYTQVDDPQADDETSYVSSLVVGNKDSFPLAALGVDSGAIDAVNRNIRARKDDVDQREIAMLTRQDSTDYEGSNIELLAGYKNFREQLLTCPDTTAWTRENFAAMEWGYVQKV